MMYTEMPRLPFLVAELQQIRPFEFIVQQIDTSDPELCHWYLQAVHYAAPLLNSGAFDRMATGRTWEQHDQSCYKGKNKKGTPSEIAVGKLWAREVTQGVLWNPLETNEYHHEFCRAHALTELPPNIKALTNSCPFPIINEAGDDSENCGECHHCLWAEKVQELLAAGKNTNQINVYRKLKGIQYGGGHGVAAPMRGWLPIEMGKGKIWAGCDTMEKLQNRCQTQSHYTYEYVPNTGLWTIETSDLDTTEQGTS